MLLIWQIVRKPEALLLVLEDVSAYAFPVPEHVQIAALAVADVLDAAVAAATTVVAAAGPDVKTVVVDVPVALVAVRLVVQNAQGVALFFVILNVYKIVAEDAIIIVGRVVIIRALAIVILCAHRIVMIAVQNNKDVIFVFYPVHA